MGWSVADSLLWPVAGHEAVLTVVGASSMEKGPEEGGKAPRNYTKNLLCNQADMWGGEGLAAGVVSVKGPSPRWKAGLNSTGHISWTP